MFGLWGFELLGGSEIEKTGFLTVASASRS